MTRQSPIKELKDIQDLMNNFDEYLDAKIDYYFNEIFSYEIECQLFAEFMGWA